MPRLEPVEGPSGGASLETGVAKRPRSECEMRGGSDRPLGMNPVDLPGESDLLSSVDSGRPTIPFWKKSVKNFGDWHVPRVSLSGSSDVIAEQRCRSGR